MEQQPDLTSNNGTTADPRAARRRLTRRIAAISVDQAKWSAPTTRLTQIAAEERNSDPRELAEAVLQAVVEEAMRRSRNTQNTQGSAAAILRSVRTPQISRS